jgi:RNase P subunit RPR2
MKKPIPLKRELLEPITAYLTYSPMRLDKRYCSKCNQAIEKNALKVAALNATSGNRMLLYCAGCAVAALQTRRAQIQKVIDTSHTITPLKLFQHGNDMSGARNEAIYAVAANKVFNRRGGAIKEYNKQTAPIGCSICDKTYLIHNVAETRFHQSTPRGPATRLPDGTSDRCNTYNIMNDYSTEVPYCYEHFVEYLEYHVAEYDQLIATAKVLTKDHVGRNHVFPTKGMTYQSNRITVENIVKQYTCKRCEDGT